MGVPDSQLHELERQRLELEGNILKLQDSLYHWRTWEAEYDGLKEEINDLPEDADREDFLSVGHSLGGSLVTEDEVKVILGEKEGVTRTKGQVVSLIDRRIDYVKQNVATMEKRLRAAENELYALNSQEQLPSDSTAEFPMTEIFEELDDNGNIVSSTTNTPGSQASELLNILQKAGVSDIPDTANANTAHQASSQPTARTTEAPATEEVPTALEVEEVEPQVIEEEKMPEATTPENNPKPPSMDAAGLLEYQRLAASIEESPEDAQLRRDMLQYSLNEVGAVVAELELDEDASDVSVDEEYDDYPYDDDEEEEDEYGRTKTRVLDEDYHREMRELEAKLNARGLWNIGKNTDSLPTDVKAELEQPGVVRVEQTTETGTGPVLEKKPKKKVAFADDLDIAPAPRPPTQDKKVVPVRESSVPVLADSVVERTEPVAKEPVTKDAPKKVSRFKSARRTDDSAVNPATASETSAGPSRPVELRSSLRKTGTPSPAPSSLPLFPARPAEPKPFSQPISVNPEGGPAPRGPEGKILADTLVERDVSQTSAVAPEPDELDEQLHRKEIATEFYQIRNRMIKEQGGFVDEEPEIVPLDTEEAPRRVSKFKAARMR